MTQAEIYEKYKAAHLDMLHKGRYYKDARKMLDDNAAPPFALDAIREEVEGLRREITQGYLYMRELAADFTAAGGDEVRLLESLAPDMIDIYGSPEKYMETPVEYIERRKKRCGEK